MLTPAEIATRLESASFVAGFSEAYLWRLARAVKPRRVAVDETLFEEGDARRLFAIVLSGAVAIEKAHEGRSHTARHARRR
jgi:aspartate ammonia-lyase